MAAGDVTIAYASASGTALTVTNLHSLGDGSAWNSDSVDNEAAGYLDYLIQCVIRSNATGVSTTGYVDVYIGSSVDDAAFGGDIDGTEGSYTGEITNLKFVQRITVDANATIFEGDPFTIASLYNGIMPADFAVAIENNSGAALHTSLNTVTHNGVFQQVAQA